MPPLPPNDFRPKVIKECKRTYVVAEGRGPGAGATATAAVTAAKAAARAQLAIAEAGARALQCPARGGCPNPCAQGSITVQGSGLDWSDPRKVGGVWTAKAWAYKSFYRHCNCPRS